MNMRMYVQYLGVLKKIYDGKDLLAVLLQQVKYLWYGVQKSVTVHHEFLPSQTYSGP